MPQSTSHLAGRTIASLHISDRSHLHVFRLQDAKKKRRKRKSKKTVKKAWNLEQVKEESEADDDVQGNHSDGERGAVTTKSALF